MNRNTSGHSVLIAFLTLLALTIAAPVRAEDASEILKATGVKGGLIVHIGCGDGRLTAALRASDKFIVQGLDRDPKNVEAARKHIQSLGLYGPVSVTLLKGNTLPYIDNLVNLVVSQDLGAVSMEEVMRVLAPLGVAYVRRDGHWIKKVKPYSKEMDEWTHYLHGPDNNAVANDTVVAPPQGLQWVSAPMWSRAHSTLNGTSCMVSSGGRVFTIEDLAPIALPLMPGKYTLVARDAFNGIILWKRRLENWENITHWMKPTPVQLSRRLVAVGDRVYVTLGIFAPVTALDAATGEIVKVYEGTEKTQEIIYHDGVLYLVVGDPMNPYGLKPGASYYREHFAVYWHERYSPLRLPKENPQYAILAVDASSGEILWRKSGNDTAGYQATTLAVRGDRLAYQTETHLVYADRKDGRVIWKKSSPVQMNPMDEKVHPGGASPTLVLCDRVILRADAANIIAFSTKGGSELWRTPTTLTYHSPPDIFVVGDTVWFYPSTNGYNIMTGEVVATRRETRDKPMGHDRCYRNKATVNYLINSRSGGADFSRLGGDFSRSHPWVRGTCSLGIMPCNGLLYASPHACSCVNETLLYGFYALRAKSCGSTARNLLEKGTAYEQDLKNAPETAPTDWATYRHDINRSGNAGTKIPVNIKPIWTARISNPTAPVVAAGRVLVADEEGHTVYSLDAASGKTVWKFTAGGRVDSPPTYARGYVLFGCADGWIYCLRADTGELVWRFRAAPEPKLAVAFGQVESLWRLHGSVLVLNDIAYIAAGRHSFLDGGIWLYGLDLRNGEKKYETRIRGPYGEDGESVFNETRPNQIKGNKNDILVSDGELVYLRHMAFKPDLASTDAKEHLLTVSGFLDDSRHHRSYWTIAKHLIYDTMLVDNIDADLLVLEGRKVFGTRVNASNRGPEIFDARKRGFPLFAMHRDPERAAALRAKKIERLTQLMEKTKKSSLKRKLIRRKIRYLQRSEASYVLDWQVNIQVHPVALLKAGEVIFVAGMPNEFPEDDIYRVVEGRAGGVLVAASSTDGKVLKTYRLQSPPVWDGMAAANGKLFISLANGQVQCWGAE